MKFVDTHCSDLRIMKFDCSLFQSWMIIMQSSKYKVFKRLIKGSMFSFFHCAVVDECKSSKMICQEGFKDDQE